MAGGRTCAALAVEPVECLVVEPVPAELVDDEHAAGPDNAGDPVERAVEVGDVVERERGDSRVERVDLVEILELEAAEAIALGRRGSIPSASYPASASAAVSSPCPQPMSSTRAGGAGRCSRAKSRNVDWATMQKTTRVSVEEARRIAVRAQLLDGSATGVLETVRRLGFLQIDVVQPVERPQHLVLFSRLGPGYDRAELDRLLWEERSLIEWDAFIYPIEELPLIRARIRNFRRSRKTKSQRWVHDFLTENRAFRRYVLRELERNGPMLSRDFEDLSVGEKRDHRWWGKRMVGLMLLSLHVYGEITVVGRNGGERLWDLTPRWWPETETVSIRDADRIREERRFRTQGVRLVRGEWVAHPDASDGPVPDRAVLLSPFDRLVYDRNRAEALWDFRYRLEMFVPKAKREYGYYVLPLLVGETVVGRAEPRFDRKTRDARAARRLGRHGPPRRGPGRPRSVAGRG